MAAPTESVFQFLVEIRGIKRETTGKAPGRKTTPPLPLCRYQAEITCRFSGIVARRRRKNPLNTGLRGFGTPIAISLVRQSGQPAKVSRHEHQLR
jgi:hypothetical protein